MLNRLSEWKSKLKELGLGVYRYNIESRFRVLSPRSVMINLTYKCNSRCVMCNIWQMRPKKELSLNEWKKIIADPVFGEIRNLTISGGEPLLYPDYIEVMKVFMDSLPKLRRLSINTNGFVPKKLIQNMEVIAKICQEKNIKLVANISIDGVGKVHDRLRRIPEGFEKCVETLEGYKELSRKYGFGVGVSSVLLRQTIGEYEVMKNWIAEKGVVGSFQIVGFHESFLNNMESEQTVSINNKTMSKFLQVLRKIRDSKSKMDFNRYYWEDMISMYQNDTNRTTPCSFLKDDFVIDSLGDVYYCLSTKPIGNILRQKLSVGEIYFDPKNLANRKNMANNLCKKCNSGCNVTQSTAFDLKRWLWYKLSGKLWKGEVLNV